MTTTIFYKEGCALSRLYLKGYRPVELVPLKGGEVIEVGSVLVYSEKLTIPIVYKGVTERGYHSVYGPNITYIWSVDKDKLLRHVTDRNYPLYLTHKLKPLDQLPPLLADDYIIEEVSKAGIGTYVTYSNILIDIAHKRRASEMSLMTNSYTAYSHLGFYFSDYTATNLDLLYKVRKLNKKEITMNALIKNKQLTICQRYWLSKYKLRPIISVVTIVTTLSAMLTTNFLGYVSVSVAVITAVIAALLVVIINLVLPTEEILLEIFMEANKVDTEVVCPLTPVIEDLHDA